MPYNGRDTQLLKERGVENWNQWRRENPGIWPDLVAADLRGMDLRGVDFFTADLRSANLSDCNLQYANLGGSILIWTDLTDANLRNASVYIANLNGAILSGADLTFVTMGVTILVDLDLRSTRGLEHVKHVARSHVGLDTIYRSKGEIPARFLSNAGVPDEIIKRLSSLGDVAPPSYYSCFISYSSADDLFVHQLYSDLRARGVSCWYAPEDMKIGTVMRISLDEEISRHDKLLLVLSATSVKSHWVEQEVEKALERERTENRLVLFPVRIDDAVFSVTAGWAAQIKRSRHIGDFRNWQNPAAYDRTLARLLNELRSSNGAEAADEGNLLVQPEARSPLGRLPGLLHHLAGERPVTVEEMNEAVKQRAAKRFREPGRR